MVSNLFCSKSTVSTSSKAATLGAVRKVDGIIRKNSNSPHHRARESAGEMRLAATVKSRMLRFLHRSTNTRGPQGGSSSWSSRRRLYLHADTEHAFLGFGGFTVSYKENGDYSGALHNSSRNSTCSCHSKQQCF